jgi:hypothetical protein
MQKVGFLVLKLMFMECVFGCLWLCGVEEESGGKKTF